MSSLLTCDFKPNGQVLKAVSVIGLGIAGAVQPAQGPVGIAQRPAAVEDADGKEPFPWQGRLDYPAHVGQLPGWPAPNFD